MKLGILGLPKVGKTTLFNALTSSHQATDKFVSSHQTNLGVATVSDPRLDRLQDLFQRPRCIPATVEYVDIPGIERGDGTASLDLPKLRTVDALLHVVRAFADPEILHCDGEVDPGRDVATVDLELVLADYELVKRRLERLRKDAKRGLTEAEKREEHLLAEVVLPNLEGETPLRELALEADQERCLRGFQLLSAKPMLVVLNVGEDDLAGGDPRNLDVETRPGVEALVVSASLEEEIAQLEPEEQKEFLADLGLTEASATRVVQASYRLLGLLSFFTVSDQELRAWTLRRGAHAKEAAGTVHSDMARGFIRAEVARWEDVVRLGSIAACRERGVLRLEGKDYVVQDGDVLYFRFKV